MTTVPPRPALPARPWRAVAGVAAAAAAVGVGHAIAGVLAPAASPLLAVGAVLIDAAPTPAKEFAVRTFGTADKPILLASIALVLTALAAGVGLLAWHHRRVALVGIAAVGGVGMVAGWVQGGPLSALPSLGAVVAGVLTLHWLSRRPAGSPSEDAQPDHGTDASGRRAFLLALAGTTVLAAAGGTAGVIANQVRRGLAAARRVISLPTPVSAAPPLPPGVQVEVAGMTPFVTPAEDFYRVDISLVTPRVDPTTWTLTIDGAVDRPLQLSYDDLLAMPMIERDITLTCVSNEVGGGYVSTARWLGVPFTEIIRRVGVQAQVDQVFSYSSDSGYTCSTPYQAVSDGRDAMIVVGMNGAVLPDARGFPARMLVPGLFGFVSATKWLERIEFTTYARRTAYWTERDWATDAPVLTQARIDVPKSLSSLPRSEAVLAGVAWAQHRGIAAVEISIDGRAWEPVTLAASGGIDVWRQWSYRYDGPPGLHSARVRATDGTGATQPEQRRKVFPAGATGWHEIQFTVE